MKNAKMNALLRTVQVLVAAMACAGVAQAGNVCTWTGLAGDGKWSSPENWDVQPVSGNLDEVRMSGENGLSISNDVPGMSVAKLIFTGNEEVEFSGEQVTIANVSADSYTIVWSNACPVLCHTPLKLDSRHWRIFASAEVRFMGELYSRFSDVYCLVTDNKPGAVIEIHGGLTAAGGSIFMDSRSDIRIFSPVTGGRLRFNSNNYTGVGTNSFHAPLAIKLGISYRLCVCHAENILYPDGDIIWEGTHTGGCLDLNGFDQTSGCLGGVYKNGTSVPNANGRVLTSEGLPATLTVKGGASATTYASVRGMASVCYAPANSSFVQTFAIRSNDTCGNLTVSNGTLRIDEGSTWTKARELSVWETGTFEITPTNGVANPFPALQAVRVKTGGKIKIPAGVALSVPVAFVDGLPIAAKTYSGVAGESVEVVPWIEGAGTLTVRDGDVAVWGNSAGGLWNDGANWSGGVPSAGLPAMVSPAAGQDFEVAVSSDAAVATNLAARGDGKVKFDVSALWPFSRAWLDFGRGAEVEVGSGGELRYDGGSTLASDAVTDNRIAIRDGASITVKSGGSMIVTNAQGRLVIGGSSTNSTGTVTVEAGGLLDFAPGVRDAAISVCQGGLLDVKGTCHLYRLNNQFAEPLRMSGGTIRFSGSGYLEMPGDASMRGVIRFGTGLTRFSDSSRMKVVNRRDAALRWVVAPTANGETAELLFEDSSKLDDVIGLMYVGNYSSKGAGEYVSGVSKLTVKDNAKWVSNSTNMKRTYVGNHYGEGILDVSHGQLTFGTLGLSCGYSEISDRPARVSGLVRLSDGAKIQVRTLAAADRSQVDGDSAKKALTEPYGLVVGSYLKAYSASAKYPVTGRLEISGASTTVDLYLGHVIAGLGRADGVFAMSGGTMTLVSDANVGYSRSGSQESDGTPIVQYATNCVVAVGMHGGRGAFVQTGGTVASHLRTFVGGCETNQYFDGEYTVATAGLIGQRTSEGLLSVSNGTFSTSKSVVVGSDGSGTLEIGPAGRVSAETLVLSNQTESVLRFVVGADGFTGGLAVTNMVVASGAKLEVDLRSYAGDEGVKFDLVDAANVEGWFDPADISIVSGENSRGAYVERNGSRIAAVIPRHGMMIIFR